MCKYIFYSIYIQLLDYGKSMTHRHWILASGVLWLGAGLMLFYKGIGLASIWGFFPACGLGLCKGHFVLSKTAARLIARLCKLPLPIRITQAYPLAYWILLSAMMGMGFLFRLFPDTIRGFADVAIGCALIYGSHFYFLAKVPEVS
jgi:hypothetical protein